MNSIFDFATKELSQDAVICWCLNWANFPETELFGLGIDMLSLLGEENYDEDQELIIKTQFMKADIVVLLPKTRRILIIEDKVYSTEHDDQIATYKKKIETEKVQRELGVEGELVNSSDIRTIYFKTGFFYDDDILIGEKGKADVVVRGIDFYNLIQKYAIGRNSEILISFENHLKRILDYYENFGDYTRQSDSGEYYISEHTIAQYKLLRSIFPEEEWNRETNVYRIYEGSSMGRPWSETCICPKKEYQDGDVYEIFWRVDSDSQGPYLSLRYYDTYTSRKDRHIKFYVKFVELARTIVESGNLCMHVKWESIKCGNNGSYKESALVSFHLAEYLEKWEDTKDQFIETIRQLSRKFAEMMDDVIIGIEENK